MTTIITIIICLLVLLAYLFDITASKTRVPTVIILLTLGWALQQAAALFRIQVPDMNPALPFIGTVGLILIVLEGTLDLELKKERTYIIRKSMITALLPMILMSLIMAAVLSLHYDYSLSDSLLNSIPLAVISSAIAIPSARHLSIENREFVVYESSMSDILGILFFNYFLINQAITMASAGVFLFQMIVMLLISVGATFTLSWLLSHTRQKIKFIPIILIIILIYSLSKLMHLPGLIFIMVLGLFLGNLAIIPENRFIRFLKPEILSLEVIKFRDLTSELTFLVRSIFFILFGFIISTADIIDPRALPWSLGIVGLMLMTRALQLKLTGMPLRPLLFISPRGLITILLFLSIPASRVINEISSAVIIQVIVLSSLIMALGSFLSETAHKTGRSIANNENAYEDNVM